jgi:hypothetical protein
MRLRRGKRRFGPVSDIAAMTPEPYYGRFTQEAMTLKGGALRHPPLALLPEQMFRT